MRPDHLRKLQPSRLFASGLATLLSVASGAANEIDLGGVLRETLVLSSDFGLINGK